ncbi:Glycosyl hydrolase family 61 [Venturia nashicola]|uniref:Glycosyl hydrolase family 61 n=1 Tax=Venturia nashicola TaxID=86259 RepID=A0A4Z1PF03_9PEZI|nr:Glycosyl hydrolase family 61 [Venturia nashicola]TLD31864.1 Glycosyl hydrolase family 61 [Venturia nashicola]
MKSFITAATLATFASQAVAHGVVSKIIAGTKTYQGYSPDFQYMATPPAVIGWTAPLTQDHGFVPGSSLGDPDIICHKGATNAKLSAEIAAGESVSLQWTTWPDSHHGPMIDYLADCGGDCTTVDKTTLKWFKIDGVGMTSTTGTPPPFADDTMIKNNMTWTVKIPTSIKAGNYVLRHETIALHSAGTAGQAQNYPQCVNLQITGGGSAVPEGVVGTSLYKTSDPGLLFNIYQSFTNTAQYTVPGPTLWSGAGGVAATSAPASVATSSAGSSAAVKSSSAGASSAPVVTSAPASPTTAGAATTASITAAAVKTSAPASSAPATTSKTHACKKKRHARNFAVKN